MLFCLKQLQSMDCGVGTCPSFLTPNIPFMLVVRGKNRIDTPTRIHTQQTYTTHAHIAQEQIHTTNIQHMHTSRTNTHTHTHTRPHRANSHREGRGPLSLTGRQRGLKEFLCHTPPLIHRLEYLCILVLDAPDSPNRLSLEQNWHKK